jgi:ferredoxin
MPKVIPGRVTWLSRLPKETNDAHLFAQSAHAPDQTDTRPQLLHCPDDLTARLCHDARFFMKFRGPKAHPNRHQVSGAVCRKLGVCPRVCPRDMLSRSSCPQNG